MFCRSLFVLLYFFFWPLFCLFFFDIQILITPLVSSNSSYKSCILGVKVCMLSWDWEVSTSDEVITVVLVTASCRKMPVSTSDEVITVVLVTTSCRKTLNVFSFTQLNLIWKENQYQAMHFKWLDLIIFFLSLCVKELPYVFGIQIS